MLRSQIFVAGLMAVVSVAHADPEQARRRLEESAEALRQARTLSFAITLEAKGPYKIHVEGTVELKRQKRAAGLWIARLKGESELPGMEIPYDLVIDGDLYTWIDHDAKKVMQRMGKAASDRQITIAKQYGWIRSLTTIDPFDLATRTYETMELVGRETIEGVECDVIVLREGPDRATKTWYISTGDHLPRRMRIDLSPMMDDTFTMSKLKLNEELAETVFEIATPEGYAEDFLGNVPTTADHLAVMAAPLNAARVREAPSFELEATDGSTVKIEDLRGEAVVLEFLLTYSGASRRSGPEMKVFLEAVADKPVKVLTIPVRERSREKTLEFFEKYELTQTVLHGGDDTARIYGVTKYPMYVLVDAKGMVAYETGYIPGQSFQALLDEIESLLGAEGGGDDASDDASDGGASDGK